MQDVFHINFGKKRTTLTVDSILSELMAIKLGVEPGSEDAHSAVRQWLQKTVPEKLGTGRGRKNASQWTRRYLIEEIADRKISTAWTDWRLKDL
ncbi:MAG TPA: hypothetical protein VIG33_16135 [Pseudobdellovibrionaceae bacterium]|jgi:argininosuccinate lyase